MTAIKYRCVICGKVSAGRLPRQTGRNTGDTSFYYPRRHKVNGKPCAGNIREAEVVAIKTPCAGGSAAGQGRLSPVMRYRYGSVE